MTTEKILAALDKPRKLYSILMVVNPSGSSEELQQKLLKMRDEGPSSSTFTRATGTCRIDIAR